MNSYELGPAQERVENIKLQWNRFSHNLRQSTELWRTKSSFTDIILAAENKQVEAHRFILASGSDFFQNILSEEAAVYGKKYIYLFGIRYDDLISLLDFMYTGEAVINNSHVELFMSAANKLGIKGLVPDAPADKENVAPTDKEQEAHTSAEKEQVVDTPAEKEKEYVAPSDKEQEADTTTADNGKEADESAEAVMDVVDEAKADEEVLPTDDGAVQDDLSQGVKSDFMKFLELAANKEDEVDEESQELGDSLAEEDISQITNDAPVDTIADDAPVDDSNNKAPVNVSPTVPHQDHAYYIATPTATPGPTTSRNSRHSSEETLSAHGVAEVDDDANASSANTSGGQSELAIDKDQNMVEIPVDIFNAGEIKRSNSVLEMEADINSMEENPTFQPLVRIERLNVTPEADDITSPQGKKKPSPKKGRPKKNISTDVNNEQTTESKTAKKRKLSSAPQEAAQEETSSRIPKKRAAKTTPSKKAPRKPTAKRSKSMPEESSTTIVIQGEPVTAAIEDLNLHMDDSPDKSTSTQIHSGPTKVKRKSGRPPKVKESFPKQIDDTANELTGNKDSLPEDDSRDIVVESQVGPVLNQILELAGISISDQSITRSSTPMKPRENESIIGGTKDSNLPSKSLKNLEKTISKSSSTRVRKNATVNPPRGRQSLSSAPKIKKPKTGGKRPASVGGGSTRAERKKENIAEGAVSVRKPGRKIATITSPTGIENRVSVTSTGITVDNLPTETEIRTSFEDEFSEYEALKLNKRVADIVNVLLLYKANPGQRYICTVCSSIFQDKAKGWIHVAKQHVINRIK